MSRRLGSVSDTLFRGLFSSLLFFILVDIIFGILESLLAY